MTYSIMEQIKKIKREEIEGKDVIELGSGYSDSGNARPVLEALNPDTYIGIDIRKDDFVDLVCDIRDVAYILGKESFDVVISTEVLEHIKDWRTAVNNMIKLLKPNGMLFVTARSKGFHYHGVPYDYWRFSYEDFATIFSDMKIELLVNDSTAPGIIIKATKPKNFSPIDLSHYEVEAIYANT